MSTTRPSIGLLPVFLVGGGQLDSRLRQALARSESVTVLEGPSDAGKSTLLRECMGQAEQDRIVDLSLVANGSEADDRLDHAGPLGIDHLDRLAGSAQFHEAYELLTVRLPARLPRSHATVLVVNDDWSAAFASAYGGLSPADVLRRAAPTVAVELVQVAPYSDMQLNAVAERLHLDVGELDDPRLRLAGVLAIAASHGDSEDWSTNRIRAQSVVEWVAKGGSDRQLRQALWDLAGRRALRGESGQLSRSALFSSLDGRYETSAFGRQLGGPFQWRSGALSTMNPSYDDVAAASMLRSVIMGDERMGLPVPMRASVLRCLLELSGDYREELLEAADGLLHEVRTAPHADVGYLPVTLGATLLAGQRSVHFEGCRLQGPEHQSTDRIPEQVAGTLTGRLVELFHHGLAALVDALGAVAVGGRGAYGGDGRIWERARVWARGLPLRALVEDTILHELPADRAWRHEDVLDVAVTGATTAFMAEQPGALEAALRGADVGLATLLADVWDGLNDGAWDQLLVERQSSLEGLLVLDDARHQVSARDCRLQRAQLRDQDLSGWTLERCDLHLADLRSCQGLLNAGLAGSNWWSAMLAPADRYELMRRGEGDERLASWMASPPWTNPYYTDPWPAPLKGGS